MKATCICNIQKNNLFHLLAVGDRQLSSWTSLTLADLTRAGSIWLWLNVHVYGRFFCNLPQCSGIVNIVFSQLYFWSGDLLNVAAQFQNLTYKGVLITTHFVPKILLSTILKYVPNYGSMLGPRQYFFFIFSKLVICYLSFQISILLYHIIIICYIKL